MLDECGLKSDNEDPDFVYNSEHDWIVGVNLRNRRRAGRGSRRQTLASSPHFSDSYSSANSPTMDVGDITFPLFPPKFQSTVINDQRNKRKHSDSTSSDSELGPPHAKYAKSELLANDSSFEIEVCHEKVNFDVSGSEPIQQGMLEGGSLDSTLAGDGTSMLDVLVRRVAVLLPGIRIEERLSGIPELDVQKAADFLAHNGYMNHLVLKAFRRTDVSSLSLGLSLFDEDGLNIGGQDIIRGAPLALLGLVALLIWPQLLGSRIPS